MGAPPSGFSEQRNIVVDSCQGTLLSDSGEQRIGFFYGCQGTLPSGVAVFRIIAFSSHIGIDMKF